MRQSDGNDALVFFNNGITEKEVETHFGIFAFKQYKQHY